jgi:hypothetical protein
LRNRKPPFLYPSAAKGGRRHAIMDRWALVKKSLTPAAAQSTQVCEDRRNEKYFENNAHFSCARAVLTCIGVSFCLGTLCPKADPRCRGPPVLRFDSLNPKIKTEEYK